MGRFPDAQLSRPIPGNEHLRFLNFNSPALRGRGDVLLFVPLGAEKLRSLPLMLLLHGVYGCQWNWWLNGEVDQTALAMLEKGEMTPMVIAMPSDGLFGDGSGYVPHANADYERWVVEDIPQCVGELFPQTETGGFYLAGLSMGGFGALRLGMRYAERVAGISAHSAVTDVRQLPRFIPYPAETFLQAGVEETSILYWARRNRSSLPPMRFDCGVDDSLIEENRALHRALTEMKVPHVYEEFPGGHDWAYWTQHVRQTLAFFTSIAKK